MTKRFIQKLIATKAIDIKEYILNNYTKLNLNETSAFLLLHLYQMKEQGIHFISIKALTGRMSIDLVSVSNLVLSLVQQGFIELDVVQSEDGKHREQFTLEPLYEKIIDLITNENIEIETENQEESVGELVQLLETEFGRPLSGMEIEFISDWVFDYHYSFDLIKLAIKEALLSNAYNIKYIDRILLNWQKKNIRTVEEAASYTKTFKRFDVKKQEKKEKEEYVSWMTLGK